MPDKWSAIDNLLGKKLTAAYLATDKLISRCKIDAKCTIAEMRLNGTKLEKPRRVNRHSSWGGVWGARRSSGDCSGGGLTGPTVEPGPQGPLKQGQNSEFSGAAVVVGGAPITCSLRGGHGGAALKLASYPARGVKKRRQKQLQATRPLYVI